MLQGETPINLRTTEQFIDMIYHQEGTVEFLVVLDCLNIWLIHPASLEATNVLSLHYRDTDLKCMVGRYSRTQKKYVLFVGDIKGMVRIYTGE